jgi:hypothetical protein
MAGKAVKAITARLMAIRKLFWCPCQKRIAQPTQLALVFVPASTCQRCLVCRPLSNSCLVRAYASNPLRLLRRAKWCHCPRFARETPYAFLPQPSHPRLLDSMSSGSGYVVVLLRLGPAEGEQRRHGQHNHWLYSVAAAH